jgi:hypothetical protein
MFQIFSLRSFFSNYLFLVWKIAQIGLFECGEENWIEIKSDQAMNNLMDIFKNKVGPYKV